MRRKSLDQIVSLTGLVVTIVLVVAGMLLMWGGNFAKDTVTQQLTVQNIAFDEDAAKLPPELARAQQQDGRGEAQAASSSRASRP